MHSPKELAENLDKAILKATKELDTQSVEDEIEDRAVIDSLLRSKGILEAIEHIRRETSLFLEGYLDGQQEFRSIRYALPYQDPLMDE